MARDLVAARFVSYNSKQSVIRKIDNMDSSSESEFEEETLFLYALYHRCALLATSFYVRIFFCYSVFMLHRIHCPQAGILPEPNSFHQLLFPVHLVFHPETTTVKLNLDLSHMVVSLKLYIGLHWNRTQVYSQHSYAGSDWSPAV